MRLVISVVASVKFISSDELPPWESQALWMCSENWQCCVLGRE